MCVGCSPSPIILQVLSFTLKVQLPALLPAGGALWRWQNLEEQESCCGEWRLGAGVGVSQPSSAVHSSLPDRECNVISWLLPLSLCLLCHKELYPLRAYANVIHLLFLKLPWSGIWPQQLETELIHIPSLSLNVVHLFLALCSANHIAGLKSAMTTEFIADIGHQEEL